MISEALEIRDNKITAPVMILGFTPLYLGEELINNNIEQTVYDFLVNSNNNELKIVNISVEVY